MRSLIDDSGDSNCLLQHLLQVLQSRLTPTFVQHAVRLGVFRLYDKTVECANHDGNLIFGAVIYSPIFGALCGLRQWQACMAGGACSWPQGGCAIAVPGAYRATARAGCAKGPAPNSPERGNPGRLAGRGPWHAGRLGLGLGLPVLVLSTGGGASISEQRFLSNHGAMRQSRRAATLAGAFGCAAAAVHSPAASQPLSSNCLTGESVVQ